MVLPRWEKRKHERAQKVALIRHNLLRYVQSIFPKQTAAIPAAKLTGRGYICSSLETQSHDAMEFMFVPLTLRAQELFGNKYGLHSWPKRHQLEDVLKRGEVEVKLVETGETGVGGNGRGGRKVRMIAEKHVSVVGVGKRRRIVDSGNENEEEEQEDEVEDVANMQLRMEAAASESMSEVAVSRRLRSTRVTRSSVSSRSSVTRRTRSLSSASTPQQQQQRERSKRRRIKPPTPPDPESSFSSSSSPEPRATRRLQTRSYPPSSGSSSASSSSSTTPASPPLKPGPAPLSVPLSQATTTLLPPTPLTATTPAPLSPSTFTPLDFSTPTSASASRTLLLQAAESVSLQARQRYMQISTLVEKNRDLTRRVRMLEELVGKLEREMGRGDDTGAGLGSAFGGRGENRERETGGTITVQVGVGKQLQYGVSSRS